MNEFITASLKSGDVSALLDFPKELQNEFEIEIIGWIARYTSKFSRPPTVIRLRKKFPHFVPIEDDDPAPLGDIVQMTFERKTLSYALSRVGEIETAIRVERRLPTELITRLLSMSSLSGGIAHYSSYDRSAYIRSKGYPTGFRLIDHVTGGISKGDYFLIVGRLGTKKSTLAQWLTYRWWESGLKTLYVSNESLASDVFAKIDAMSGRFNPLSLRSTDPSEVKRILETVKRRASSGKGDIIVPTKRLTTPSEVAVMAQNMLVDLVVIDGVYLMAPDERGYSSKWEKVAAVSNRLKQIALDLQIPFLGITQLKRMGEKLEIDPEDIAYSDALGQDADIVLAMKPNKALPERVELQLVKNRFGPEITTTAYVDFDTMQLIDESIEGPSVPGKEGGLW